MPGERLCFKAPDDSRTDSESSSGVRDFFTRQKKFLACPTREREAAFQSALRHSQGAARKQTKGPERSKTRAAAMICWPKAGALVRAAKTVQLGVPPLLGLPAPRVHRHRLANGLCASQRTKAVRGSLYHCTQGAELLRRGRVAGAARIVSNTTMPQVLARLRGLKEQKK